MKTVCLGDSLTFGYGVDPRECWVSLAGQFYGGDWVNCGICGDTALGMLARLNTLIRPLQPRYVLIMGGYNDILITGSFQQAQSAMMAMVHQCAHAGVRPVIGIPIPMRCAPGNSWRPLIDMNRAIAVQAEYTKWLRLFVQTLHLRSVDFAAAFEAHAFPDVLYQSDGLHPTAQGHLLMAKALEESLIWRKES